MIVTEQVQDTMGGEETDFRLQSMTGKARLTPGDGHANDDVAIVPRAPFLLDGPVGKGQDIRRRTVAGELAVEAAHFGLPFQNHGQPTAAGALMLQRGARRFSGSARQQSPGRPETKLNMVVHQVLGNGAGSGSRRGSLWGSSSVPG